MLNSFLRAILITGLSMGLAYCWLKTIDQVDRDQERRDYLSRKLALLLRMRQAQSIVWDQYHQN